MHLTPGFFLARLGSMKRKLIGYADVDSGQLMITDPCYTKGWVDDDVHSVVPDLNDACSEPPHDSYPYSYGGACAASCNLQKAGQLAHEKGHPGAGIVISSGFGDGSYPVYVEYEDTGFAGIRPKRVIIEFWGDEEEE